MPKNTKKYTKSLIWSLNLTKLQKGYKTCNNNSYVYIFLFSLFWNLNPKNFKIGLSTEESIPVGLYDELSLLKTLN